MCQPKFLPEPETPLVGYGSRARLPTGNRSRTISLQELMEHFHLPINEAACKLGVCVTVLKQQCREHGIQRWPFRKVRKLDNMLHALENSTPPERLRPFALTNGEEERKRKIDTVKGALCQLLVDPNSAAHLKIGKLKGTRVKDVGTRDSTSAVSPSSSREMSSSQAKVGRNEAEVLAKPIAFYGFENSSEDIVHESVIDQGPVRLPLTNRLRISSAAIPAEMMYAASHASSAPPRRQLPIPSSSPSPSGSAASAGDGRFVPNTFQYNARVASALVPCVLVLLGAGGPVVVGTLVAGLMLSYVLDALQLRTAAFVAIWTAFFSTAAAIAFSGVGFAPHVPVPLSLLVLLSAVNLVFLCGVWVSLQFRWLHLEHPFVVLTLERLLFACAPITAVAIVTWGLVAAVGIVTIRGSAGRNPTTVFILGSLESAIHAGVLLFLPLGFHVAVHRNRWMESAGDICDDLLLFFLPVLFLLAASTRGALHWLVRDPSKLQHVRVLNGSFALAVVLVCGEVRVIFPSFSHYIHFPPPLNYLLVSLALFGLAFGFAARLLGLVTGLVATSVLMAVLLVSAVAGSLVLGMPLTMLPAPAIAAVYLAHFHSTRSLTSYLIFAAAAAIAATWFVLDHFFFLALSVAALWRCTAPRAARAGCHAAASPTADCWGAGCAAGAAVHVVSECVESEMLIGPGVTGMTVRTMPCFTKNGFSSTNCLHAPILSVFPLLIPSPTNPPLTLSSPFMHPPPPHPLPASPQAGESAVQRGRAGRGGSVSELPSGNHHGGRAVCVLPSDLLSPLPPPRLESLLYNGDGRAEEGVYPSFLVITTTLAGLAAVQRLHAEHKIGAVAEWVGACVYLAKLPMLAWLHAEHKRGVAEWVGACVYLAKLPMLAVSSPGATLSSLLLLLAVTPPFFLYRDKAHARARMRPGVAVVHAATAVAAVVHARFMLFDIAVSLTGHRPSHALLIGALLLAAIAACLPILLLHFPHSMVSYDCTAHPVLHAFWFHLHIACSPAFTTLAPMALPLTPPFPTSLPPHRPTQSARRAAALAAAGAALFMCLQPPLPPAWRTLWDSAHFPDEDDPDDSTIYALPTHGPLWPFCEASSSAGSGGRSALHVSATAPPPAWRSLWDSAHFPDEDDPDDSTIYSLPTRGPLWPAWLLLSLILSALAAFLRAIPTGEVEAARVGYAVGMGVATGVYLQAEFFLFLPLLPRVLLFLAAIAGALFLVLSHRPPSWIPPHSPLLPGLFAVQAALLPLTYLAVGRAALVEVQGEGEASKEYDLYDDTRRQVRGRRGDGWCKVGTVHGAAPHSTSQQSLASLSPSLSPFPNTPPFSSCPPPSPHRFPMQAAHTALVGIYCVYFLLAALLINLNLSAQVSFPITPLSPPSHPTRQRTRHCLHISFMPSFSTSSSSRLSPHPPAAAHGCASSLHRALLMDAPSGQRSNARLLPALPAHHAHHAPFLHRPLSVLHPPSPHPPAAAHGSTSSLHHALFMDAPSGQRRNARLLPALPARRIPFPS
ncbi:unnamed protein product [Closterium sp. Yama58-4]|nr:unnamed protein product [Closterium sp. Yama58-4]